MLSERDLAELESTLLPALERHHLRLLAHSLRCLQQAAGDGEPLPDPQRLTAWAQRQSNLAVDPTFIPVLVEQLTKAAVQLEQIALDQGRAPLELQIADLVRWGRNQADQRIGEQGTATPPFTPPAP
ncbi:hypothetical protein [Vulcanococcus sp.]|uniref:hypothetical protein n=1 Tax=Vulcanococcus sp. TaxID=2856995 RepID=UPI0037DA0116